MRNEKLKISDKVLMQKVADEAVLLDLDSQSYFGLDPVGTLIWEAVADGNSKAEIVERIIAQFDIDAEVAQRDLQTFLDQLADDELISVGEEPVRE